MQLEGIHHITAITGDAPRNVDFYTRVLGLRLAAKTVNQDDPTVYHLFYADEQGRPGSELTFFEYPGVIPGRAGAGMVHRIVWRVAFEDAVAFWDERLSGEGIETQREDGRLVFADFEGLAHELAVDTSGDVPLAAEHPEVPAEFALIGFDGVRAYSDRPADSGTLIEGHSAVPPPATTPGSCAASAVGPHRLRPGPGRARTPERWHRPPHRVGPTAAEHQAWQDHLTQEGIPTSGIVDRHYFHSIYFREPSGVLFEIADDAAGLHGRRTARGAGLEDHPATEARAAPRPIESLLTPLPDPRAGWAREGRGSVAPPRRGAPAGPSPGASGRYDNQEWSFQPPTRRAAGRLWLNGKVPLRDSAVTERYADPQGVWPIWQPAEMSYRPHRAVDGAIAWLGESCGAGVVALVPLAGLGLSRQAVAKRVNAAGGCISRPTKRFGVSCSPAPAGTAARRSSAPSWASR